MATMTPMLMMQAGHMGSRSLEAEAEYQRCRDAWGEHQRRRAEHEAELKEQAAMGVEVDEYESQDWQKSWSVQEEALKQAKEQSEGKAAIMQQAMKDETKRKDKVARRTGRHACGCGMRDAWDVLQVGRRMEKLRSENQRLRAEGKHTEALKVERQLEQAVRDEKAKERDRALQEAASLAEQLVNQGNKAMAAQVQKLLVIEMFRSIDSNEAQARAKAEAERVLGRLEHLKLHRDARELREAITNEERRWHQVRSRSSRRCV